MKRAINLALASLLSITAPTIADEMDTEFMVAEKCSSCHGTEIYTREDRKVDSLQALGAMVRACNTNTGAQWFDDEVDAVIAYLNSHYYKFGD